MRAMQVRVVTDSGSEGPVVVLERGLGGDQTRSGPVVPLEEAR
jgi:hypothetical protein